jgi:hypothetical protein
MLLLLAGRVEDRLIILDVLVGFPEPIMNSPAGIRVSFKPIELVIVFTPASERWWLCSPPRFWAKPGMAANTPRTIARPDQKHRDLPHIGILSKRSRSQLLTDKENQ